MPHQVQSENTPGTRGVNPANEIFASGLAAAAVPLVEIIRQALRLALTKSGKRWAKNVLWTTYQTPDLREIELEIEVTATIHDEGGDEPEQTHFVVDMTTNLDAEDMSKHGAKLARCHACCV